MTAILKAEANQASMSNELNLEALQEISGGMAPIVIDWKELSGKRFKKGYDKSLFGKGHKKWLKKVKKSSGVHCIIDRAM